MKTFKHIVLAFTALLLVASCAIDEMWEGVDTQDEEKVLTFRPKFEDFESVTKAIGDGSKVDKLLVQVYADGVNSPEFSQEYNKADWNNIKIPFFYGKTYKVYFWAYAKSQDAYEIAEGGLKNGVTVKYPENTDALDYDALEYLDAFYAVETINLSDNIPDNTNPSLTRPFAQVNLMAKKDELKNAKASKVVLELSAASAFVPGGNAIGEPVPRTFTFTSNDCFQSINESLDGNIYLGTTYIFVSSSSISGNVTLIDKDKKTLKGPSPITIPLAINSRTNLVFSGIEPAKLPWDDNKFVVPEDDDNDGWIHITRPEELAALLIKQSDYNINVHICDDIDMGDVDDEILNQITGKSFLGLKLDGGIYPDNNMEATPTGNNSIKNISAAAFIGTATNLTVLNLNVDNLQISSATGHVGTLVNTLKGTSSFSNVTVSNSSATTGNGAAGGIVGYIERIDPTNRSEVMEVAFYNCKVNGAADKPVATGSLAEGKFVGLLSGYDNGETLTFDDKCSAGNNTTVADYASRYVEGNESAWQSGNNYSAYSGFLGDEKYLRAKVYFGGEDEAKNRFCPKWDGTTNTTNLDIEPLLANATYDKETTAGTNRFVVYSAFDLAGVRKKTASPAAIYLMNHVDLFGQGEDANFNVPSLFSESANNSTDDNKFTSFSTVALLEGFNHTIYNLKIEHLAQGSTTAAFIGYASGTTKHQNVTFESACVVSTHKEVASDAKAYGAILCCSPAGTYTATSVHINNSKVFALQKVGIVAGRVSYNNASTDKSTFESCVVSNCYMENYKCTIPEDFAKLLTDKGISCTECIFYPYGEIGGFIGFLQASSVINNCSVNNTTINCWGQNDKSVTITGFIPYSVPGRHVNQFIGDIRTDEKQSIVMTNVSASNNIYSRDKWNYSYTKWWTKYETEYAGCAYAIPLMDNSGSLKINSKNYDIRIY